MSSGWQYYATLLLVYLGVDLIACFGLNIQLGLSGVMDFAFIIFQAVGAYVYAVFTLGHPSASALAGGGQSYIWGAQLPFPIPFVLSIVAGMVLAFFCAVMVLPRLRGDYEAMAFLVISLIVSGVATNQVGLVNGANGLSGVPQPLSGVLGLSTIPYDWFFVGLTAVMCFLAWGFTRRISTSPMGRLLRAVRENELAARSLGKDATRARLFAFVVGGGLGGLSGAVLVAFITAWSPASWGYAETFVYITAVVVGGFGSDLGVLIGVLLVPIIFGEAVRFLPSFGQASWVEAAQLMAYGLLTLLFLWFRPEGLVPERRHTYPPEDQPLASSRLPSVLVRGNIRQRPGRPVTGIPSEPLLTVSHVSRRFGGVQAVADASLFICHGESLGLIGPNGAGKSTVLSIVAGALKPDTGSVLFAGEEIAGLPSHKVGSRGLVRTFQISSEFPRLTVLQNLLVARPDQRGEQFWGMLRGRRAWSGEEDVAVAQARELLARFHLIALQNEYAGNLSGGQRRLLEVARAIMARPKMLLLDEPTAGVHPKMVSELRVQLRSLRDEGLGMLMVEHELGTVEHVCQRVVVMARGSVIAEGALAEVRAWPEVREAYVAG